MILYAKSSLELIVNNRIGKVGIRPDARPAHHRPVPPRGSPLPFTLSLFPRLYPADRLPPSATHLI